MWTSPSPSFDQVMSEFLLHFARFQVGGWKLEADFGKKEKGNIRSCVIKEKAILDCFSPGSAPFRAKSFWHVFQSGTFYFNDFIESWETEISI